jgi:hypothetical protein
VCDLRSQRVVELCARVRNLSDETRFETAQDLWTQVFELKERPELDALDKGTLENLEVVTGCL